MNPNTQPLLSPQLAVIMQNEDAFKVKEFSSAQARRRAIMFINASVVLATIY
jgi:hypothetical protein